jgi:TolA-binding protein
VRSAPSGDGIEDWKALATAGKYTEAYAQAARRGVRSLASAEPSAQLLTLAETCRFAGHSDEGAMVLTELRRRFPGTDDAAIAAFQFGRSGGPSAAQWFRTYLAERPQGALAREASGRLLEALDRAGARVEATEAARSYLARYPTGPHAAFARQLLAR